MKAIFYLTALATSLLLSTACCPSQDPKAGENNKQHFVEAELIELHNSKPFYWHQGKRIYLIPHKQAKQYVLCRLAAEDVAIPQGWTTLPNSEKEPLYTGAFTAEGKIPLIYAVLSKEEQIPQGLNELYRGDSYYTDLDAEPIIMTDLIEIKLSETGTFRDLVELAYHLKCIILEQNTHSPKQYTLSARYSPYPTWQITHILHKHSYTLFATPDFITSLRPL